MNNNIIELRDVHTAFNGQRVHSGINLCIKEGEVMTLIGSSGVGKSVLLKELIGILKPDKGEILVMGRNIVPLKEEELIKIRRDIGILFRGAAGLASLPAHGGARYPLREHT